MKLTTFFFLISILSVAARGYSQHTRLNLSLKDASIQDLFQEIEKQSEFNFFYKDDQIDVNKMVSIEANNSLIGEVLNQVFENSGVSYTVVNKVIVITPKKEQQNFKVTGTVTASTGKTLPGVNIMEKGTGTGTITGMDGNYSIEVTDANSVLIFSFVGYTTQEVEIAGREAIDVTMALDIIGLDEVVVVGYGTQKKSDITGTVASLGEERLEMVPNLNIAQAIQGAIPGVMIQTTSAGASPDEVIMIRGRNSILASNNPLIVVDGISYEGNISDINPNDVSSIEILKDASSAAIYGSRGANGVILVTTKEGVVGKMTLSYDGYYSVQKYVDLPDNLDGAEFYDFKMTRTPEHMSAIEEAIYDAGTWENWYDVMLRTGKAQQHNLSISGGTENTKYYISGGLTDVKGLSVNDDYLRATNRINIETKIKPWLTIGTRTQFSYEDESGAGPSWSSAFSMNPLSHAYDDDGNILLYPWEGYFYFGNPLSELLYDDKDESLQIITNNFAIIDFPFVDGLSYRLNTGFRFRFSDTGQYRGRDTKTGLDDLGSSETERKRYNNSVIENILSYQKEFGKHNIFATGVYSYEGDKRTFNKLEASGFPNDFLSWYGAAQAELIEPEYTYKEKNLISQMLRLNYSFDSRYLITMTGRRDGYSGFGSDTKFGIFPSIAAGWNIANESFFPFTDIVNQLKLRASWGLNGNQAVDAYKTITRLEEYNMVDGKITVPGYRPSVLGQDNLGWESSSTVNVGLDFGILRNRIAGDINYYQTNTKDLLLNRTISPVHGISEITQNIGETQNLGLEMTLNSTNITIGKFRWSTSSNFSWNKNKILSLYGVLDEDGNEVDDLANDWFIGQPIRVNYDYEWNGVWQLDEDEAALWGSQPGFVKLRDVNGDYVLDAEDKQVLSQRDPKVIWGMTNSFSYGNFSLDIFIHGVHGVTRRNTMMTDRVTADTKNNLLKKNWWTTDNPTNDWVMNHIEAERMGGIDANGRFYQDASFVRVKDVSLSYNLPSNFIEKFGLNKGRFFITGKNLFTFTEWVGLDPELDSQFSKPLQREYVFGVSLSF